MENERVWLSYFWKNPIHYKDMIYRNHVLKRICEFEGESVDARS